nr:MAG TPA: hypothetical protein [Caudoviricetes sp.]
MNIYYFTILKLQNFTNSMHKHNKSIFYKNYKKLIF